MSMDNTFQSKDTEWQIRLKKIITYNMLPQETHFRAKNTD